MGMLWEGARAEPVVPGEMPVAHRLLHHGGTTLTGPVQVVLPESDLPWDGGDPTMVPR